MISLVIARMVCSRIVRTRRGLVLALLMLLPSGLLLIVVASSPDQAIRPVLHGMTVGLLLSLAIPVAGMVQGGAAFGEEREDETLPYLAVKPVPRWQVALGVTLGSFGATLLVGVVGVLALWIIGGAAIGTPGIGFPALVAVVIAVFGYTAIFVPMGLITKRTSLAGLLYIFLWEGILARPLTAISPSSIWRTALSSYVSLTDQVDSEIVEQLGTVAPGTGGAFAKVLVLTVLSVALSTLVLRKRDLV